MTSLPSKMYSSRAASRGAKFGASTCPISTTRPRHVSQHAAKPEQSGSSMAPVEVQQLVDGKFAPCNGQTGGIPAGRKVVAGLNIKLQSEIDDVDSRSYMEDVLNLSVDLDSDDEDDDDIEPPQPDAVVVDATPSTAGGAVQKDEAEEIVSAERLAARKLVQTHDPVKVTAGEKHHWMVVMVPEQPVAGESVVFYFNRNQSNALRERPRIQLQYGFNKWELKPEGADKVDLQPTAIPRESGADFWSVSIKVPKDSFEINYIFSDGEFVYENNSNQDFCSPVVGGIDFDQWIDLKAAKALAELQAKQIAAAEAAAVAERERQVKAIQKDKDLGRKKAQDLKQRYESLHASAMETFIVPGDKPGVVRWCTEPSPRAGEKFTVFYNIKASNMAFLQLKEDQAPTLMYGFNGWTSPGKVVMSPHKPKKVVQGEEWYQAQVDAPVDAVVMNMVFNCFEHYDNNDRNDYAVKIALPVGETLDSWIDSLAEVFRVQIFEERTAAEEAKRAREEARNAAKKIAQEAVQAVERRKVRHVLYTEPETVTAGQDMNVYYNPTDTNLSGRQAVYLIAGFNRWEHPRKFGPLQMEPPAPGCSHFKATVKVPLDAYKIDMVFTDDASGSGTYDNRGGLDYNLPVVGSPMKEPSMHVVHISVEMAPIAKVGGLGDVVTALGRAVQEQGHQVEVVLPRYDFFLGSPVLNNGQMKYETEFDWGGTRIFVTTAIVEGLRCFFIEPRNGFFATQSVYGRYDDEVRFDFFCKAALEFLLKTGRQPDILHCHDWSTASVAKNFWEDYQPFGLWKPKVVFTIHNMNYGQKKLAEAAYFSQKFTTVSPTYAYETGSNPIINPHLGKFLGVRNGIDMDLWDPENNQFLPVGYTADNVVEGKAAARQRLRERVGLTSWGDKFIVGVVSRLTGQKGVHLIKHAAFRALERGGQFVLLGSAPDPKIQAEFELLAGQADHQNAKFVFKYDEPLSHLIYAGCDMICVPSMFEPCGLTQMIAMRYGSVPIVRHTGGLKDTVFDVDFDKARAAWEMHGSSDWERDQLDATNGFAFDGTDPGALDYAMNRAIDAWYNDKEWFQSLQKRVMEQDWSWNRPALDYIELYHGAKKS